MTTLERSERDGFQRTTRQFTNPSNTVSLDPIAKRTITICNLFANHRLPIKDIVRVLDEEYRHVVKVLIQQGLVGDRRLRPRESEEKQPQRGLFRNRSPR